MVAPLLEVLLLRVLRRRAAESPTPPPTRLVSRARAVETLGHVEEGTSVLLQRPGAAVEVLPAGSLVWPPLLPGTAPAYAVVTHAPVEVWLRVGPFETLEGRPVHQVELRLTVALGDSPAGLRDLVENDARTHGSAGHGVLDGLGDHLLERLAREVSGRTADAVRRRTLADLTSLSLGLLLDETLPATFLDGVLRRCALEVVDVDWPTEGRVWPQPVVPLPGGAGTAGPAPATPR